MNSFTHESNDIKKKKKPQSHIYRHLQDQGPRINEVHIFQFAQFTKWNQNHDYYLVEFYKPSDLQTVQML